MSNDEIAVRLHHRLVAVHPFANGNGRHARTVADVLIDAFDVPDAMIVALIRAARGRGALPFVTFHHMRVTRELMFGAAESQHAPHAAVELARMRKMQEDIERRGSSNI